MYFAFRCGADEQMSDGGEGREVDRRQKCEEEDKDEVDGLSKEEKKELFVKFVSIKPPKIRPECVQNKIFPSNNL